MSNHTQNRFKPDYAIPPGETLRETLETIGMSQAELASRTGRPTKTINEIIKGKAAITSETALQFERVLGVSAGFWNNLERQYRETLARLEEQKKLLSQVKWPEKFPVREMINAGLIEPTHDGVLLLQRVLNYFGVASPESWQEIWGAMPVAFRKSQAFKSDPGAIAVWLRKGEIDAQQIVCKPYSSETFKDALVKVRALTVEEPDVFCPKMQRVCAKAGVAVVFVPEIAKTRASGATRWLTPSKALIQLSLRYKSDDHLWFTFFHEAGHILLHGKSEIFLEGVNGHNEKEEEANQFAMTWLIPANKLKQFMRNEDRSLDAVRRFARELGIAPGIVVGQLQHVEFLERSHCNELKRKIEWADIHNN